MMTVYGQCVTKWREYEHSIPPPQVSDTLTTSHGHPIDDKANTMTIGERGPVPIQDFTFLDEMAHFDRERIPERVVHAKGAGQKWGRGGVY